MIGGKVLLENPGGHFTRTQPFNFFQGAIPCDPKAAY